MATVAPVAPGKLGTPLAIPEAMTYLESLGRWIDERRRELDTIDQAILASPQGRTLTNDMMLSMSLWQAVKSRHDLLLATWDSGRVGPRELERLSALVWGRLDDTLPDSGSPTPASAAVSGLSVSLPEACKLSDALAGQLRSRLALDPSADQQAGRLRQLRAQLERLRDQVALEPITLQASLAARVEDMAARTSTLVQKVERGGDVGGMLGPLEVQAATMERDLIVENTKRRQNRDKLDRARELREALMLRQGALSDLVAKAVTTVAPAPKYAVPNVESLGPIPSRASELDGYMGRLTQVSNAMQVVQNAYGAALATHTALLGELATLRREAEDLPQRDQDLDDLAALIQRVLERRPAPVEVARHLLDAYRTGIRAWVEVTR